MLGAYPPGSALASVSAALRGLGPSRHALAAVTMTDGFIVENETRSALLGIPHFLFIYRDQRRVSTIIVEAKSLAAARLKAATIGLDTPNSFRLAHELEAELIPLVLPKQVGRILSAAEAKELLTLFEGHLSTTGSRPWPDLRAAE